MFYHIAGIPSLLFSSGGYASPSGMKTPHAKETTTSVAVAISPSSTPPLYGMTSLDISMPETHIDLKELPEDIANFALSLPPTDFLATPDVWQYTVQQAIGGMIVIPRVTGRHDRRISMVAPVGSSMWIRTFESDNPAITGYLIQTQIGCELLKRSPIRSLENNAQSTCTDFRQKWVGSGLRAYIKVAGQPIEDVTTQLTPPQQVLGEKTLKRYEQLSAGGPFLDDSRLDTVPVARWIVESDPDNPLPEDAHTFDGGYLAHAGFLLWNGDHFETRATVPAALWPCPSELPSCLEDDRFVTKP
ncbi:hypothetical protein [Stenotrophomonas pictorum]|nr:hypothetical protein [Stenotrophomonas pictorum]